MTWKELKELLEKNGAKDDLPIAYIDIHGLNDLEMNPLHLEEFSHGIAFWN